MWCMGVAFSRKLTLIPAVITVRVFIIHTRIVFRRNVKRIQHFLKIYRVWCFDSLYYFGLGKIILWSKLISIHYNKPIQSFSIIATNFRRYSRKTSRKTNVILYSFYIALCNSRCFYNNYGKITTLNATLYLRGERSGKQFLITHWTTWPPFI